MTKIIAIGNHKGGVGKTTSTINIGAGLSQGKKGEKVLLIDLDPQANLTQSLNIQNPEATTYTLLKEDSLISPINITEKFHIIPSILQLPCIEGELRALHHGDSILGKSIVNFIGKYDYIFIDCPPSLGILTINALTTSDEIYIPLQTEVLALYGLTKLLEIMEKIQNKLNPLLTLGGVILTQYSDRKTLHKHIVSSVEDRFKEKVFKTKIRDTISLAEAQYNGIDIFSYNSKSIGAKDYLELCKEILKRF